jgi:hypothetical protein
MAPGYWQMPIHPAFFDLISPYIIFIAVMVCKNPSDVCELIIVKAHYAWKRLLFGGDDGG